MEKTTLIIGAGASQTYGMPLAKELKESILKECNSNLFSPDLFEDLYGSDYPIKYAELKTFTKAFGNSGIWSIDAFIETLPEFKDIGKHYIAYCLLPYEKNSLLTSLKEDDWLGYIFNTCMIYKSPENLNKFNFVTFNYDRIIENYFFSRLSNIYRDSKAFELIDMYLNIHHVHGSLGEYKEIYSPHYSEKSSFLDDHVTASKSAKSIHIVHENSDDLSYQKIVSKSKVIAFLGLSPHPVNINKVWDMSRSATNETYGTCLGLEENEINNFKKLLEEHDCQLEFIEFATCDCLHLLRKYPILPKY